MNRSFNRNIVLLGAAGLIGLGLSACTPVSVAAGAGATVGIAAAQEGGIKGAVTDQSIRIRITELWMKHDLGLYRRVSMTVKEGRVLVTGDVPSADMRVDAIRLAWQAEGVRQVINEIRVDGNNGIGQYATDTLISNNLKAQMIFDKYVQSINYSIDTTGGTVYIMGIAQDQKELDHVVALARNTKYVKDVVSYVRMRGETPAGVQDPTMGKPVASN